MTDHSAFIEGFCKVAEENGVDPELLAKYAASVVGDASAGLGTRLSNGQSLFGHPNSYMAQIRDNWSSPMSLRERISRMLGGVAGRFTGKSTPAYPALGFGNPFADITWNELNAARASQAQQNADKLFPRGSVPNTRARDALIRSGRINEQNYKTRGNADPNAPYPSSGLEFRNQEQRELFRRMQQSMVRNGGPGAVSNIA